MNIETKKIIETWLAAVEDFANNKNLVRFFAKTYGAIQEVENALPETHETGKEYIEQALVGFKVAASSAKLAGYDYYFDKNEYENELSPETCDHMDKVLLFGKGRASVENTIFMAAYKMLSLAVELKIINNVDAQSRTDKIKTAMNDRKAQLGLT